MVYQFHRANQDAVVLFLLQSPKWLVLLWFKIEMFALKIARGQGYGQCLNYYYMVCVL